MEYIYNGETNIPHGKLKSFLTTAENLEIKGLEKQLNYFNAPNFSKKKDVESEEELYENNVPLYVSLETDDEDVIELGTTKRPSEGTSMENSASKRIRSSSFLQSEPGTSTENGVTYNCQCGKQYFRKSLLYRHQTYECGVEPSFSCQYCSRKFSQKCNLQRHIDTIHLNTKNIELFPENVEVSSGDEANDEVNDETNSDDSKPFSCHCGKVYKKKTYLRQHQRFDCGVEPSFSCEYCWAKFSRKPNLKRHIALVHLHQRPGSKTPNNESKANTSEKQETFPCHCGKSYKTKQILQRHQTFECGVEPTFSCDFCGRKIKRKDNLLRHIERMHSDKRITDPGASTSETVVSPMETIEINDIF